MFINNLYTWHSNIERDLPWTLTKNPYKIWLSEIILQQTRVDQGRAYYYKFIDKWPTVSNLANAHIDDVLRAWQGLGYYTRARNLHASAQIIRDKHKGIFPSTYDEIIKLKGVGAYTASAIASFAFGLCHPVLDGNVMRVMSRYYGITEPVDEPSTVKKVNELLDLIMDKEDPAHFNQAMMDFGATHCTPKNPSCTSCLMSESCKAYNDDIVAFIPLKVKKVKRKLRFFHYLEIIRSDHIMVEKRVEKDIWEGLYQLPLVETLSDIPLTSHTIAQSQYFNGFDEIPKISILDSQKLSKHVLTHQDIIATVYQLAIYSFNESKSEKCENIPLTDLDKLGFPKLLSSYLEKYKIID